MDAPIHCRSEAYWTFCQEIEHLDCSQGLLNSVVAVSMHFAPNNEVRSVQREIAEIGDRILERVPSRYPRALAAHLHQVLFEDLGFLSQNRRFVFGDTMIDGVCESDRVGGDIRCRNPEAGVADYPDDYLQVGGGAGWIACRRNQHPRSLPGSSPR